MSTPPGPPASLPPQTPTIAAHNVMRFMTMVYADTTRILDRMESVRVNLTASCFRKYLTDSAPAILSFLPALRTFCLAARRQNVADLVNFIGKKELIWLELTCCNVLVALEKGNVCLVDLEKNDSFWEQITPILAFDKQLRIVRSGLSEIERTFLRERKDAQHATQPSYSWGSIWFAAADALDYISGEDRDWFKVKCDLAGWGNGLFHTKLTLDHVLQDEKAYENLHPTIVNGFTWILVYADLELQRRAHKSNTSRDEALQYHHEQIRSLLDSDDLWIKGMNVWLTMGYGYAIEDVNPVIEQLDDCFTPLKGVQMGMGILFRTTQLICHYENKLWHAYPELYQAP